MSACIPSTSATTGFCTANIVASGSASGSGDQMAVLAYTAPSDGFYMLLGEASVSTAVFFSASGPSNYFSVPTPSINPFFYYLTSGSPIYVQVTTPGAWSYNYTIYSL